MRQPRPVLSKQTLALIELYIGVEVHLIFEAKQTLLTKGEEYTVQSVENWYRLAIFGARALAAQVLSPYDELMLAIESGLEHDLDEMVQAEWSIKLACAWLAHGSAMPLLEWAVENMEDDNITKSFGPGPLYHGPAIMCFERWQFWLHRLDQLANQATTNSTLAAKGTLATNGRPRGHPTTHLD